MHTLKKRALPKKEEQDLYDLVPYGYGVLEPGEWFWLTHRFPPRGERPSDQPKQTDSEPRIRITFRARE